MINDKWWVDKRYKVEIPEWLLEQAFCEVNKEYIETETVVDWALDNILPFAQKLLDTQDITICANHFHMGTAGLTPRDHLPHAFTSILYLTDAEGELVIHLPAGKFMHVTPEAGLLVTFPAHLVHHVEQSPIDELRVSLASNYEFTTPV